jgi:hypothetical protein
MPRILKSEDLEDREIRGVLLAERAKKSKGIAIVIGDDETLWMGRSNRAWSVKRSVRNRRGVLAVEYVCQCGYYNKNARLDCLHITAERIRRDELIIEGKVAKRRAESADAVRRPARKRVTADGRTMRSVQRAARVALPDRLPELMHDLKRVADREMPPTEPRDAHANSRATALVWKIASGKSADEMIATYRNLIESGVLRLKDVPHQNTLSRWMNDPRLTPIFEKMLELTARVFRAMEVAAMVDSSKMSQMRSAHSRWVEYGDDEREAADWMKMHAIVGVETMVCMAVIFSGTVGEGTHDSKFLLRLLEKTQGLFLLRYLLADKAYLTENIVGRLWELGIQAVIPVKRRWDGTNMKRFYEAYQHLVRWYDDRQADFHETYRLRVKIESFFSSVKRVTSGFCWSRGRKRKHKDGAVIGNAVDPCTAWKNETLCKVIYVNLRRIVEYEQATGYRMNFLIDTFFPAIPDSEKLVA